MNLKISTKLPIVIVSLALIALGVTAFYAMNSSEKALEAAQSSKLEAVQEARISNLTNYLGSIREDVSTLAQNHMVIDAIKDLEDSFAEFGPAKMQIAQRLYIENNANPAGEKHKLDYAFDGSTYSEMHKKYHPWFRKIMEVRGYYDVFLVNEDGDVVYSVYKEADYATNLLTGKWKDSDLAKVFRMAQDNQNKDYVAFTDFAPYAPSAGVPASFIGVPVFEDAGNFHGALIFQMPVERINQIMQNKAGLGETGESFLVGRDKLMRSESTFTDGDDILKTTVDSEAVAKSFANEDGTMAATDYRGIEVLTAYGPIEFNGVTWAVIAKLDMEEVDIPVIEMRNGMLLEAGIMALVIAAVGIFFARSITNPISNMTTVMGVLANGDLTAVVPSTDRHDEIGEMAAAVEVFKANGIRNKEMEAEAEAQKIQTEKEKRQVMLKMADDFEASVGGVVNAVSSASTEMQSSAQALSATAEQTSQQSAAVAAASEEASTNVQTVASASEELSSSISEISRQVAQSTQIAGAAVAEVEGANEKVQGLADAAKKIGEVVALITDIADQTNLLALNATIEAARAGEAGKGFAVVASEVKNLANATAKATEEISAQIGGIQGATQDAVTAINSIGSTIAQMSEIASTIAAAVEEQGAATQEIARNVEQAAAGTNEVSSNITGVNQAAADTGHSAGELLSAATELSQQSEMLRSEVNTFLDNIRNG
ncbi:MAG TPA: methyl-accepting chemotaxis protein [Magnetovibrio sp.]